MVASGEGMSGRALAVAFLTARNVKVSAIQFLLLKRFARFGSAKVSIPRLTTFFQNGVPMPCQQIPSVLRLGSAALCDTGIAISLCYFLHQKRTGYRRYAPSRRNTN